MSNLQVTGFIDMEIQASNCSDANQGRAPTKTSGKNVFKIRADFGVDSSLGLRDRDKRAEEIPEKSTRILRKKGGENPVPST